MREEQKGQSHISNTKHSKTKFVDRVKSASSSDLVRTVRNKRFSLIKEFSVNPGLEVSTALSF